MDFTVPKVACPVCNGKGGFRRLKQDFLDSNWNDCGFCEGYGFVDDTVTTEDAITHLTYNHYRTNIVSMLNVLGEVQLATSESEETDMFIQILPFDRKKWTSLMKHVIKFSYFSDNMTIIPKQAFYYDNGESHYIPWELHITMHSLEDLDGLLDLIRLYNETLALGGNM